MNYLSNHFKPIGLLKKCLYQPPQVEDQDEKAGQSSIRNIPVELIHYISILLEAKDLVSLYSSCKYFKKILHEDYRIKELHLTHKVSTIIAQNRFGKTLVASSVADNYAKTNFESLLKHSTEDLFYVYKIAVENNCEILKYKIITSEMLSFDELIRMICFSWEKKDNKNAYLILQKIIKSFKLKDGELIKIINFAFKEKDDKSLYLILNSKETTIKDIFFVKFINNIFDTKPDSKHYIPDEVLNFLIEKIYKDGRKLEYKYSMRATLGINNLISMNRYSVITFKKLLDAGFKPDKYSCELANKNPELSNLLSEYFVQT